MSEQRPARASSLRVLNDDTPAHFAGFSAANVDSSGMVGTSRPMQELRRQIDRTARSQASILLLGGRGAGKELAARAIHAARGQGHFISVHCGAAMTDLSWQEQLVATRGGTLFLRGLGALSFELQATLARALDARQLGKRDPARRPIIVASLHEDPDELATRDLLRQELLSSLGVCTIRVPSLSERLDDLPDLIAHILGSFCRRRCACIHSVTPAALSALSAHDWPENIRELRRALDHAVIHGSGARIDVGDLPPIFPTLGASTTGDELGPSTEPPPAPMGLDSLPTLAELEERLINEALRRAAGNKSEAARALGISRHKLYDTLRKMG